LPDEALISSSSAFETKLIVPLSVLNFFLGFSLQAAKNKKAAEQNFKHHSLGPIAFKVNMATAHHIAS
jgi:hypothetical protein